MPTTSSNVQLQSSATKATEQPTKPTEEEHSLRHDLDIYDDLDNAIYQMKALSLALACVGDYFQQEQRETRELFDLSDLGRRVCNDASDLAMELLQVSKHWQVQAGEHKKLSEDYLAIGNIYAAMLNAAADEKEARRESRKKAKQATLSNSRKKGPSRGAGSNKG